MKHIITVNKKPVHEFTTEEQSRLDKKIVKLAINGWTLKSYINGKPTHEYTKEERRKIFKKLLDEAFASIGYSPVVKNVKD